MQHAIPGTTLLVNKNVIAPLREACCGSVSNVSTIAHLFRAGTPILIPKGDNPLRELPTCQSIQITSAIKLLLNIELPVKIVSFGTETREIMRTRAKAFKSLASNEEWLSGEADRITGARTTWQTFAQK